MKKISHIAIFFLFVCVKLWGGDKFEFASLPVTGCEKAVLVLAPGMNGDGSLFLKEKLWTDFAKKHNMGLVCLKFSSSAEDLFSGKGYFYPAQGAGRALLDEIDRLYSKELPLVLYGFSGGAHFVSRFIDFAPNRILAWCAYSAQFWDYPTKDTLKTDARGIVACGDLDGLRWQPSFAFFYQARKDNRPWIWVNISNTGHNRSAKFENFIRLFFEEEIEIFTGVKPAPKEDFYSDILNNQNELLTISQAPELQNVFRTKSLFYEWKNIQAK